MSPGGWSVRDIWSSKSYALFTFSPLDDVKVVAVVALPDDVVAGGHLALEHRVEDFAQLE